MSKVSFAWVIQPNKRSTCFTSLRLAITIGQDRLAKPLVERRFRSQEAGHQKVEQTPQFEDIVLYRRSRQKDAVLSAYAFDSFCELRLRVLDDVTLVENAVQPVDVFQVGDIVTNDLIGCDDDVALINFGEQALTLTSVASVEHRFQVLGVLEYFVVPVTR